MLKIVEISNHYLEVIKVGLEFLEHAVDCHRFRVLLKLLLRLFQRVLHDLILIFELRHVLKFRFLKCQDRILVL